MPQIVNDPGILAAARSAIEVLLKFKGNPVTLMRRGPAIPKPGGGHDAGLPSPIATQTFSWVQTGDDTIGDTADGDTQSVKRIYELTARWDADIEVDDTWEDDEAEYRIQNVNATSGYKTMAEVIGFVKVL